MPTTWYVDSGITGSDPGGVTGYDISNGTAGNDLNNGTTPATPFLTPGKLASVMQNGDTANFAGRFRIPNATLVAFAMTTATNRVFQQWDGRSPAQFRGDNLIPYATAWTDNGDGSYSTTIAAGLGTGFGNTLAAVMVDYDLTTSIDPEGRRIPFLKRVANKAACGAVGTQFYNNGTGEITVHCKFDQDPSSALQIHYVPRGRNCFVNTDTGNASGNLRWLNLHWLAWCDTTAQKGCCIMVPGCTGNYYYNNEFDDCGFHAITHNQGTCKDNIGEDNTFRGIAPGGTFYAFYSDTNGGGTPLSVRGCKSINDKFYLNTLIGFDGSNDGTTGYGGISVEQGSEISAAACHGAIHSVGGCVKFMNPQVIGYTFAAGQTPDTCSPFSVSGAGTPTATDKDDYTQFAVQIIQTDPDIYTVDNCDKMLSPNEVAFINCRTRLQQFGPSGQAHALGDYYPAVTSPANTCYFMEGCEVQINQSKLTGPTSWINCGRNSYHNFRRCSILDYSTATGAGVASSHGGVDFSDAGGGGGVSANAGRIKARKCIFSFRTTAAAGNDERRFLTNDSDSDGGGADIAVPDANIDIKDCMIYGVTATKYSMVNTRNTAALWFNAIDPDGYELTMQPFVSVAGDGNLDLRTFGTAWDALKVVSTPVFSADVYGRPNDGGYGCFFYNRGPSYIARVQYQRDDNTSRDEYTVVWFRNGVPADVDSPTIHVIKRADGTDIIAETAMTQVGSTRSWRYSAGTQLSLGAAGVVEVAATIDGGERTFIDVVGRDHV